MQKRRNIKRVIQPPNSIEHNSNVHRRQDNRNFVKNTNVQVTRMNNQPPMTRVSQPVKSESLNIQYTNVTRQFEGETIYIIGGGPSLKNFDFRLLIGSRTIAINKAIFFHTEADVLYWTDVRFYTWYKNEIDNYKGLKFALKASGQYTNDIKVLKKGKTYGLETDTQTLAHGNNSGYAAINLAYHLGARRIVLLGFDMMSNGKDSHFHDGYPTRAPDDKMYQDKFIPGFDQLKTELNSSGVTVMNASPYSKLTIFPKITIEQALSFR